MASEPGPGRYTLIDKHELAALRARVAGLEVAARHLDDLLLRFAFDAGALPDEVVSGLGVDPWGTLAYFRATFGLAPTMTPEEWTRAQTKEAGDG